MAKAKAVVADFRLPAELYPWTVAAASQLQSAHSRQRLPHAVLVHGPEGVGKLAFAGWLAQSALCDQPLTPFAACGRCASCKLFLAATHPDLLMISPEEGKQQVSIDTIREAAERLGSTSFRGGYKVAIVQPAHQMTHAAANSLLKTLEEPTRDSLLILLSSRPGALLATVRSRCQKIAIATPSAAAGLEWLRTNGSEDADPAVLEFAAGAPLLARELLLGAFAGLNDEMLSGLTALFAGKADVTQVAGKWGNERLPERLTWLDLWLTSQLRAAITGSDELITFPGRRTHLPSLPATLNITGAYTLLDDLRLLKAQLARTALQRELAVAGWLIALGQLLAPRRVAAGADR